MSMKQAVVVAEQPGTERAPGVGQAHPNLAGIGAAPEVEREIGFDLAHIGRQETFDVEIGLPDVEAGDAILAAARIAWTDNRDL